MIFFYQRIVNQMFICIFAKKWTDNEQTETGIQKTGQRQPFWRRRNLGQTQFLGESACRSATSSVWPAATKCPMPEQYGCSKTSWRGKVFLRCCSTSSTSTSRITIWLWMRGLSLMAASWRCRASVTAARRTSLDSGTGGTCVRVYGGEHARDAQSGSRISPKFSPNHLHMSGLQHVEIWAN